MIVMKLVAMHDAVAATEVVYYASNKLDENAMHQEGPVLLLLYVGNRQKAESDERTSGSMVRLAFRLWLVEIGFALPQRQATSKVSIDIFVRFPLASTAGRSIHTTGSLPPAPRFVLRRAAKVARPTCHRAAQALLGLVLRAS